MAQWCLPKVIDFRKVSDVRHFDFPMRTLITLMQSPSEPTPQQSYVQMNMDRNVVFTAFHTDVVGGHRVL